MNRIRRWLSIPFFIICIMCIVIFSISMRAGKIITPGQYLFWAVAVVGAVIIGLVLLLSGLPKAKRAKAVRIVLAPVFVTYIVALVWVLFRNQRGGRFWNESMYSLRPFETIKMYIRSYRNHVLSPGIVISNLLGNFILFIPTAFLVPLYWTAARRWYRYATGLLLNLILVEVFQRLARRGSMDIDDVILNFSGAMLAFALLWNRRSVKRMTKQGIIEKTPRS